ncbi:MAG: DMT family transporter [Rhizobiales bacterium]|nr:DMT family transporter [Hyphomicrobiales bacterium]
MPASNATQTDRASLAGPFAALVVGAFAMGISPVFVRWAEVGPFASAFWRVTLALPVLWLWMRLDERGRPRGRSFSRAIWLCGLVFTGDLFVWHLSIVKTTVANATFFATTAPVWVVVFGWLLFGERAARATLAGLALCLVGGAALIGQSVTISATRVAGDLYGLATAVFFGLYFLTVRAARRDSGAARVTFEASLITAVLLFAVAFAAEGRFFPDTVAGWAAMFGMSWISHAGGQGLLAVALGQLPATFSSLVIFLEAVAGALFGWALLGEPVTWPQALGGLAILAGIWIARPRAAPPPPSSR